MLKNKNCRKDYNQDYDQILPYIRKISPDSFFPIHKVKIGKILERFTLLKKRRIQTCDRPYGDIFTTFRFHFPELKWLT